MNSTVIITGGTGFIGTSLSRALLAKGYRVIVLSRKKADPSMKDNLSYATWDVRGQVMDKKAIATADYIVHLAGAGVADKRWTKKRKKEIVDSRVNSCKLIVDSLRTIPNKVKAVISSSAIGWYGADLIPNPSPQGGEGSHIPNPSPQSGEGSHIPNSSPQGGEGSLIPGPSSLREVSSVGKFVETDPPADDFLGRTCKQWEESIEPVTQLGKRLVKLRTGIVLSKEGGALHEFLKPLKFGIAAILGHGKQMISWIHMDDLVSMYIAAIENEQMEGVYNAVAPNPVSNKMLTRQLAKSRKKFFIPLHVPSFVLKMVLGEMSIEVLKSATVSSDKIQNTGFEFRFPAISDALLDLN